MENAILAAGDLALLPLPERLRNFEFTGCLRTIALVIEQARSRVLEGACALVRSSTYAPFQPAEIEAALALSLADDLLRMLGRVLVLELHVARFEGLLTGDTPQKRFASFVERMSEPEAARALFNEYPVLLHQIENRLNQWATFNLEFLHDLSSDWEEIRSRFFAADPGCVVAVDAGAGDRHKQGRSVLILSFSKGSRLVYKPRSIAIEEHFQDLLAWLNEHRAAPVFRLLRTLDRGEHGWVEFVAAETCNSRTEVQRFYMRQGGLLALLYALEATDFHCENIIAAGEYPVAVDLEALFQTRFAGQTSDRAEYIAASSLGYSVLRAGLLPVRNWASGDSPGVDMSGLGGAAGQLTPRAVPQWEGVGTDEMCIVRKRLEIPGSKNRPQFNGAEVNAFEYAGEIEAGFAAVYRAILEHKADFLLRLSGLANDEVRVIARPTQIYGAILRESFHPDVLRDEQDRDKLFRRLEDLGQDTPSLKRLAAAERADLWSGDIPFFVTRPWSRDVWTSSGEQVEEFFEQSGLELVWRRVNQLSERDLERQSWIVRASLGTLAPEPAAPSLGAIPAGDKQQISSQELVAAACAVGDRLAELTLHGDGDATWLGFLPVNAKNWQVMPLSLDLYDGIPGVALFLAYLGAVCGNERHTALARAALCTMRWQFEHASLLDSIGVFHGWGGAIYALTHLGSIWSETALFDEAEAIARRIPDFAARDKELDLIGGSAGCILALRALYACRGSNRVLDAAAACGDRLLETAITMQPGLGWINELSGPTPLTGFAHGAAGIAYSLLVLATLTGDRRFRDAAEDAMRYERRLFSREEGNWPDLREQRTSDYSLAWCHGAPGIGLGRMLSLVHLDDPAMRDESSAALGSTVAKGFGSNHSLCHGDLGNLELLLQARECFPHDDRWRTQASRTMAAILESRQRYGWLCGNPLGIESPGLMTGLAGIGYELLRFAEPQRVPSILALAPPVA